MQNQYSNTRLDNERCTSISISERVSTYNDQSFNREQCVDVGTNICC